MAFGGNLTEDQQKAIMAAVAAISPLIAGLIIRFLVVSPATAGEAVAMAKTYSTTTPNMPQVHVPHYEDEATRQLVQRGGPVPVFTPPPADGN